MNIRVFLILRSFSYHNVKEFRTLYELLLMKVVESLEPCLRLLVAAAVLSPLDVRSLLVSERESSDP